MVMNFVKEKTCIIPIQTTWTQLCEPSGDNISKFCMGTVYSRYFNLMYI